VNTFVKDWKKNHNNIEFPAKSFNQLWREQQKGT
jgi:L-lactate dehydrogenase complex protein LldF